jgi:hypothetical protein
VGDQPRPIFVLGCPRSGTTLLRVMLNAHPRIAIPPENRFVRPLYFRRHALGPPGSATAARRMARTITRRRSGAAHLGLTRPGLTDDLLRVRPGTVGDTLRHVYTGYAAAQGKPRWGDKRPSYYSFVDELDRMFPDAQFVHLARDGRACVASLQRPPFSHTPARAVVTWLNAMHACRRAARRLGPDRFLELRYEDLVTRTEPTLRRLCAFLEEPFDEAMLHPEEVVATHVPSRFQQAGQIAAGVNSASLRAWERELSAGEVACVERLGRRHLRRFGYGPSGAGAAPVGLLARCGYRHLLFRLALPTACWLDRRTDAAGLTGRVARRAWRGLRPRRLLQG